MSIYSVIFISLALFSSPNLKTDFAGQYYTDKRCRTVFWQEEQILEVRKIMINFALIKSVTEHRKYQ